MIRDLPRVRVLKVHGNDLLVYRCHNWFVAALTWKYLESRVRKGEFHELTDTLRRRLFRDH